MDAIKLDKVVKEYAPGARAVDEVDLGVRSGEFLVLVGPSGCGKSTLLRMIAGLEQVTSGTIAMGGRDVTRVAARDRDIAMVFQNYALYPHMSVRANIGYGLKVRGAGRDRVAERVGEVAEMLGLSDLLDRRPAALSGGQRQRVAMGRAIARAPQVYLMDEPLSNLDAKLRVTMRAGLERLHAQLGVTTIYVTHDQIEAMTLGQRAAVLRDGVLQQVASPQELYQRPVNAFVAAFIGSPAMNFAVGRLHAGTVAFGPVRVPLPDALRPAVADDTPVLVGIRPEGLGDPRLKPREATTIDVPVAVREDLGHETLLFFPVDAPRVDVAGVASTASAGIGDDDRALFCARVAADFPARAGETATLTIAPEALHFFAPDSGAALARAGRRDAAVVR